ncbi:HAD family phosphatase, partial [Thioclava sp. BHET1]
GNVLLRWQPEAFYDRVIGPEARAAMFAETDILAVNDEIDRGADFRGSIYDLAARHPAHAEAVRMWHDNWLDMAQPAIPHSVALLRALRARAVPVFALSNFGVATFEIAEREYPFLTEFDRRYVSGHLREIKPEPEIYAILERDSGLAGAELLFTDDRADNIAAAEARGWRTHLFEHPAGWAARLVLEGLLTEAEAAAP